MQVICLECGCEMELRFNGFSKKNGFYYCPFCHKEVKVISDGTHIGGRRDKCADPLVEFIK